MQVAKPAVRNGYVVRKGRGYSFEELKEAGLDPRTARKGGVPVDVWRQTKYLENVEQLKSIAGSHKPAKKEKKAAKKG
ncbi:MAG: ribosomal protein L13e [Nitrososphaera sp.]